MATIIDGKKISQQIIEELIIEVQAFRETHKVIPGLAVVLVGEDPSSEVYVRNKIKRATEVGIHSTEHILSVATSQVDLIETIQGLNNDPAVHGILVQLPLPKHIDEKAVIEAIHPDKDVDGFHPINVGGLVAGTATLKPCTPYGCMLLLKSIYPDLSGKLAVVVGRSNIVGKPMASMLLQADCSVITVHSRSQNIEQLCSQADIIIAAVGRPKMINADWVKRGATVIDVGINVVDIDGKRKLVGDVDFNDIEPLVHAITPVPGGVGPMTIACLMKNTLTAASNQVLNK
ncbi:MAG: methylenetetrahydrofolate dehydrogenase (NADP+)/methenyltetrahydrofolate cyclohydrolase [Paraglaciecola sp.]|jgi:methylenetetrahydrofolate dehydrogenase (NADP+)/methenyltetrahydrofolate cyclohydrolase